MPAATTPTLSRAMTYQADKLATFANSLDEEFLAIPAFFAGFC
jgi:hypothetical protein